MKTNQKLTTLALIFMLCLGLVVTPALAQDKNRPLLYVKSYNTDSGIYVDPWSTFKLNIQLGNDGKIHARNIVLTFTSEEFTPTEKGGVNTLYEVDADNAVFETISQEFKVRDDSTWKYSGTI